MRRQKDAGIHKTEGKRKSNTKPHGSTYKPRYIHTPIKAGKWGTKDVIATSTSPVVLPTAVLLVVHQGASGIRTRHSHGAGCGHPSRRGRVPARHPGLLFFLPPHLKSKRGLFQASPFLPSTTAFLKCRET